MQEDVGFHIKVLMKFEKEIMSFFRVGVLARNRLGPSAGVVAAISRSVHGQGQALVLRCEELSFSIGSCPPRSRAGARRSSGIRASQRKLD